MEEICKMYLRYLGIEPSVEKNNLEKGEEKSERYGIFRSTSGCSR